MRSDVVLGPAGAVDPFDDASFDVSPSSDGLMPPRREVFFTADNQLIYALSPRGKQLCTYSTGRAMATTPAVGSNGKIYVGTSDGDILALSRQGFRAPIDATPRFLSKYSMSNKTDTLYVASEDHKLYAFDGETGQKEWSYAALAPIKANFSVLETSYASIYLESSDRKLYAVADPRDAPATGPKPPTRSSPTASASSHWSFRLNEDVSGGVITQPYCESDIFVACKEGTIYVFDRSGKRKRVFRVGGTILATPIITFFGGEYIIYVGTGNGQIYAMNSQNVAKWVIQTGGPITSSPAVDGFGNVYVGSTDGFLYAIRPDGRIAWRFNTGGPIHGGPAVQEGYVYVGSGNGSVYCLKALTAPD